jgi:hypothetical protein
VKKTLVTALFLMFTIALCSFCGQAQAEEYDLMGSYYEPNDGEGGGGATLILSTGNTETHWDAEFRLGYLSNIEGEAGHELDMVPIELGLTLNALPNIERMLVNPYVTGGVGYYYVNSDASSDGNQWGGYLGGGLELGQWSGWQLIIDGIYRFIDSDIGSLDGWQASVGIGYRL